ncbi:MAG: preprotein translocase subunit SecA [Gammaproteobacteria bacterium]
MIRGLAQKIFGSRNERVLRRLGRDVVRINTLEAACQALSDTALRERTGLLKTRHAGGESLKVLLPEAFALMRESARRTLGLRHFDSQIVGGMVLHEGRIAEMATGEGKTLVATLPVYLNALTGRSVHVVTVNEYLASRDAEWMRPAYEALGLKVGVIQSNQSLEDKKAAYQADVVYGTNHEFVFDYLRDNMAFEPGDRVHRGLSYGIVDEVDSILIDEARTPLIISGPVEEDTDLYAVVDRIARRLTPQREPSGPGDFEIDEKTKQTHLTEDGHRRVEALLLENRLIAPGESLYEPKNLKFMHYVQAGLRAHWLYKREVDYIVRDREIVIVDEFTGRTMEGRRWSEGLHQAIEAKEGLRVQAENQTLASISYQNYFRLYEKLAGMTGTADTEAYEFLDIYRLEVVVVPTHRPMVRQDLPDLIYLGKKKKFEAIVEDIVERHGQGQPILVGTTSIENSEYLSGLLTQRKVPHEVLNAKQHQREAEIVAQAGRPGRVTIATNMAGRGTDIVLGGNLNAEIATLAGDAARVAAARSDWNERHAAVLHAGGLAIIGTERHESRRIDNQLRGRAGRQGDPGVSRFYLSLEDDLMRIFAADRLKGLMGKLGMQEDEALEHPWVTRTIENAQRKVEAHNYDMRKQLLEYDDVANEQRKLIYRQRNDLLDADDVGERIRGMQADVIDSLLAPHILPGTYAEHWDLGSLEEDLKRDFDLETGLSAWIREHPEGSGEELSVYLTGKLETQWQEKVRKLGADEMNRFARQVMLMTLDDLWKEHLAAMDYLRQGIHLRGFAQVDPKQAYKSEAFTMFTELLDRILFETVSVLAKVEVRSPEEVAAAEQRRRKPQNWRLEQADYESGAPSETQSSEALVPSMPFVRSGRKVGRNEPCPCGSGLKYKNCHGRIQDA